MRAKWRERDWKKEGVMLCRDNVKSQDIKDGLLMFVWDQLAQELVEISIALIGRTNISVCQRPKSLAFS